MRQLSAAQPSTRNYTLSLSTSQPLEIPTQITASWESKKKPFQPLRRKIRVKLGEKPRKRWKTSLMLQIAVVSPASDFAMQRSVRQRFGSVCQLLAYVTNRYISNSYCTNVIYRVLETVLNGSTRAQWAHF